MDHCEEWRRRCSEVTGIADGRGLPELKRDGRRARDVKKSSIFEMVDPIHGRMTHLRVDGTSARIHWKRNNNPNSKVTSKQGAQHQQSES